MKTNCIFKQGEVINFETYAKKCGIEDLDLYKSNSYLEPTSNYPNIDEAARVIMNSKEVTVIEDCDFDGGMTTTIQCLYLKALGINVNVLFHDKHPKAHGLDDEIVSQILEREPHTLWIGDAGSNDLDEIKQLHAKGWTIVISDHHLIGDLSVQDYCTLVNNQMDGVNNKALCGAGVTWKVCKRIDEMCNTNYATDLISFVHFANIGDSMDFTSLENQTFRHWGLQNIYPTMSPFIDHYNEGVLNLDCSFGFISKFNSLIRVGKLEDKKLLLGALLGAEKPSEAIRALDRCKRAQDNETKRMIEKVDVVHDGNVLVGYVPNKTSLTGLIANKLMSEKHKPVILVHDDETQCSGSLRSPMGLRSMLVDCEQVAFASGHEASCGVGYYKNGEQDFFNYLDTLELPEPCVDVIADTTPSAFDENLFESFYLNKLYFGKGIENPRVHFTLDYMPKKAELIGRYGTTVKYWDRGINFMWTYMGAVKKEQLLLGYADYNDLNSVGNPRFKESRKDGTYTMEIIGTMDIDVYVDEAGKEWRNKVINVEEFEIKEKKELSVEDLF